jgi:hypothetical protein
VKFILFPLIHFVILSICSSHCPWVGNCIGERNYRFFFIFLFSITLLTIIATITAFQVLIQAYRQTATSELVDSSTSSNSLVEGTATQPLLQIDIREISTFVQQIWHSILSIPLAMMFGLFTLGCSWTLTSLLCFHAMIISLAQTTNERVRNVFQYGRTPNDDDHGCVPNWNNVFCSSIPPSRIPHDFTEVVICDHTKPESIWRSNQSIVLPIPDENVQRVNVSTTPSTR